MARVHRLLMTGAVIVCLVSSQWNVALLASEEERSSQPSTSAEPAPATVSDEHPGGTTDLWSAFHPSLGPVAPGPRGTSNLLPTRASAFAGQIYQGRPYRMERDRRDQSIAALMIGSVIAITGAAILVYANRPECDYNRFAGGCGYGTKVIGGAVLSGGVVGLVVGALTW